MNKNQSKLLISDIAVFALFSIIAFAAPFKMNAVFWISYAFGVVAIIAQIYILKSAFDGDESATSRFYGFPIARMGIMYLITQVILSIIFMAVAALVPVWIPVIIYAIIFVLALLGLIAADTVRDEIVRQDVKHVNSTACMDALRSIVYPLASQVEDAESKKLLSDLADSFRYSDPVSSDSIKDIEAELENQVSELQSAVMQEMTDEIKKICKKVNVTLTERNRLCKLGKRK